MRINEYVLNWIFLSHFNIFLFIFLFLISFTFKFLSWFLTDRTICLIIYCKFFSFDLDFRLEIEIIFMLAFLVSNINISMENWICSKIGIDRYYFYKFSQHENKRICSKIGLDWYHFYKFSQHENKWIYSKIGLDRYYFS